MNYENIFLYAVCGAVGGFIAEFLDHGCINLPTRVDNKVYLGFIGGMIISSVCGVIGDHNYMNAFLYGLGGMTIMRKILVKIPEIFTGDLDVICPKKDISQCATNDEISDTVSTSQISDGHDDISKD